jgi:hypothetical protein
VFFVVYSGDVHLVGAIAAALVRDFEGAGLDVIDVLRADGQRWYAALDDRFDVPDEGVPYDVSAHPFSAQSVLDGRVTHPSRDALRATLDTQPEQVAGVVAALAELSGRASAPDDADWVAELVERHVRDGTAVDDRDLARLLRGLLVTSVRDAAWSKLTRRGAPEHVRFWIDAVRRSPDPLVGAPAAVLALTAWLSGQGALAWCAVDRCLEVDELNSLGQLVAEVLSKSVSPDIWDEPR